MKRVLSITTALLLLGSTAAMAQGYRGSYNNYRDYGYHDRGGNVAGAAIGAGILGFALGALATSQNHHYYGDSGYGYAGRDAAPIGPAYGAPGYGYGGTSLSLGFGF